MSHHSTIYLIPTSIGSLNPDTFLPDFYQQKLKTIKFYIVENAKNARAFLKLVHPDIVFQGITIEEIPRLVDNGVCKEMLQPVLNGNEMGILSDAGMPCIADPGKDFVKVAHSMGVKIVPVPGPSSIFMALAASGLNGQQFTFQGYLPAKNEELKKKLREIDNLIARTGFTQIFIETPYRNQQLFEELIKVIQPNTHLSVCYGLTSEKENIKTMKVREWLHNKFEMEKVPTVFLLGL